MNRESSYFLFARPSFWAGIAALLDFGNTLSVYNESPTPRQADYFAMKSDWVAVGNDIRYAIERVDQDRAMGSRHGEQEAQSR